MKNTFFLICITLSLGSPIIGFAQSKDSIYHDIRTKYIDEKRNEVALSVFVRTPDNSISLQSRYNLLYKPNDPSAIGIRFQHKWLGLSIAYSPKRLQNKNKGNTSELDLHCFAYGRKQYLDLRYLDYTGFYIDNFKQNDTLKKYYPTYPLYPSLSLRSIGVNYCFLFNHKKLSLRASFNHNEIQRKSAGSFILGVSYNYTSFYNPTDFIPVELRPQSPPTEQYVDLRYHEISVMPGYAFTLVFKNSTSP